MHPIRGPVQSIGSQVHSIGDPVHPVRGRVQTVGGPVHLVGVQCIL